MRRFPFLVAATLVASGTHAATPDDLLRGYARQARAEVARYAGPSAEAGRRFFTTRHSDWSCASCHTSDPARPGRHAVTGKSIEPLAPASNTERFRDATRVEKWFKRNCNDTLDRACSAAEKADVLAYLLTIRQGT
ncbi:MAG TPA: DUF1924 domain-containing protein [Steroidobacteraceae bacterium]|nr:DUF1924 domain-containing protein [Steroidobacteraceae bacterium]